MSDELIGQFSPALFIKWCRNKFDRFTYDRVITSQDGLCENAKILDALKGELGPDYLSIYKKTGVEDQVIITVEQQHGLDPG